MGIYAMTGGATGIGAAIKQRLLEQQHQVIVVDIKDAAIIADLSTTEGRQLAISEIRQAAPEGLDGLITCAGLAASVPNNSLIAQVNYYGTIKLVESLKDLLEQRHGSVLLISSNSAPMNPNHDFINLLLDGSEEQALELAEQIEGQRVYAGSKQAVARWMRRQVPAFAASGVRINALAPGYTQTPMTDAVEKDPNLGPVIRQFVASIPIGRPGQPEDMADAAEFLLSDKASFVCGSVLFVDGGHDAMMRSEQF